MLIGLQVKLQPTLSSKRFEELDLYSVLFGSLASTLLIVLVVIICCDGTITLPVAITAFDEAIDFSSLAGTALLTWLVHS